MTITPEALYVQLGRIIETMPQYWGDTQLPTEVHQWVGRAGALIEVGGNISDNMEWNVATKRLNTGARQSAVEDLRRILFAVLGAAELNAPAGMRGSFIPVGGSFDAYAAISKVLQLAKKEAFIVDPYLSDIVLTDFCQALPDGIQLRLLADEKDSKSSLAPAAARWVSQHGAKRPLAVRLAPWRVVHDRCIFVDGQSAWALTQSLTLPLFSVSHSRVRHAACFS